MKLKVSEIPVGRQPLTKSVHHMKTLTDAEVFF